MRKIKGIYKQIRDLENEKTALLLEAAIASKTGTVLIFYFGRTSEDMNRFKMTAIADGKGGLFSHDDYKEEHRVLLPRNPETIYDGTPTTGTKRLL